MEKKIGKNVSSGAKKVERVEKEQELQAQAAGMPPKKKTPVTKSAKKSSPSPKKEKRVQKAVKQEKAAAEKRLDAAKKKAERKERKLLKRAEIKQKKIERKARLQEKKLARKEMIAKKRAERKQSRIDKKAALKEKRIERHAEKIARREMLKNESKAEKQKRIAREKKDRLAMKAKKRESRDKVREERAKAREAARVRKAENKENKRAHKTVRKSRTAGFGGWLAAVISLGVVCLALATVVTAGGFRMNEMNVTAENGYRSTLYEMLSVSEDLDNNLSKLRVSSGNNEQRKLLTNVLVDSALLESALERVPVDQATSTDISSFVNKTGAYARTLLGKLAAGHTLTEKERNTVVYLYNVNDKLCRELNELVINMEQGEFRAFLKGAEGAVSQKFGEMGQTSKEEPEEIVDAPFSGEGNVKENRLAGLEEVTSTRAEELLRGYMEAYHISEMQYTGETASRDM
ncbi:MAG: germination protein YpeB, partial [Clostridia bacterium]|nr:germination protein YpeB [Clostridia bacterium]